jgi:hypothetical protein
MMGHMFGAGSALNDADAHFLTTPPTFNMDYLTVVFSLVGGLALFLFGMRILSDSLKKAAGDRLKKALDKLTSNW